MHLPTTISTIGFFVLPLILALPQGHEHWSPTAKWNKWGPPTATWDPWCLPSIEPYFSPSPVVVLPSGVVIGTTTSLPSATVTVNKFLGIPFAQSPPERFSPPQAPAPWWPKPINATAFTPACIQQFATGPQPEESEDCLYLNVFAPATPAPKGGRSVFFWIYGGSLQQGWAGLPMYDGSSFAANQDIIVVTTNYRTNVFGFSNSPEIPFGQQNSGFLDQRAALEWVQKNIFAFGGNPNAVTVVGESAGGYSVEQIIANPPQPLTFRAAIIESEGAARWDTPTAWTTLLTLLNCTDLTGPSALACARAAPATTIQSLINVNAIFFNPIKDNVTCSRDVAAQLEAKTFAHVPFIIGTNKDEGRLFAVGETNVTSSAALAQEPGLSPFLPAIEASYPTPTTPTEAFEEIADIITSYTFQCPVLEIANTAVANGYTDVWRYYFNASFPNAILFPDSGVYHGSEIPEVFGTYNTTGATTQQIALSKLMQTTGADFVKNPAAGPGWPKWGTAVEDLADFGGDGSYGEYEIDPATVDGRCGLYAPVLAVTGI